MTTAAITSYVRQSIAHLVADLKEALQVNERKQLLLLLRVQKAADVVQARHLQARRFQACIPRP